MDASATPQQRLRLRVRGCGDAETVGPALQTAALAEVSAVLDEIAVAAAGDGVLPVGAINDVALLHRLRAMGLAGVVEERHACGAAQVLAHVVEPASLAPAVRAEVAAALMQGAPTHLPALFDRMVSKPPTGPLATTRMNCSRSFTAPGRRPPSRSP
ncbi:hypothetical protein [Dactylosporangium cerinum]